MDNQNATNPKSAKWDAIREAVNIAGSVTSITGISLVWLKTSSPNSNLALAVPVFLVASLFAIGTITTAYMLFGWGYRRFVLDASVPGKVVYVCFGLGVLLSALGVALTGIYIYAMVAIYGSYQF